MNNFSILNYLCVIFSFCVCMMYFLCVNAQLSLLAQLFPIIAVILPNSSPKERNLSLICTNLIFICIFHNKVQNCSLKKIISSAGQGLRK